MGSSRELFFSAGSYSPSLVWAKPLPASGDVCTDLAKLDTSAALPLPGSVRQDFPFP